MADTAHKTRSELEEIQQSLDKVRADARAVAALVRKSKHMIAFTGAGISTSAGISDFRGPNGVWTRRAQGKAPKSGTSTIKAIPTYTHMALVALMRAGYLKHLISQNTDGLHRRSGIDVAHFSELHGCSTLERCKKCKKEYLRDYRTRTAAAVHDHATGRLCACGGALHDSIINFGESLPEDHLESGMRNAERADLCLSLGSSLRVTPAADMPEDVGRRSNADLVVVNLQRTPMDNLCSVRPFAKCDAFMELLMAELGVAVPPFRLERFLTVSMRPAANGSSVDCVVKSTDAAGTPYSIFKAVRFRTAKGTGAASTGGQVVQREPFVFRCDPKTCNQVRAQLQFQSHLGEPDLEIVSNVGDAAHRKRKFVLRFDPANRSAGWEVEVRG